MAEAILKVVIDNVTSLTQGKIGLIMGVDKEMKKLSNTLTTIQKVLEDAEHKQFQSKSIQNWLGELNSIAYEIEDILDECQTEVSNLKRKGTGEYNLKKILYKHKIARRMKKAVEKLESIAEDRHKFHLQEIVVQNSNQVDWRRETGFVLNEPDHIYGRNEDNEKIVDLLVNRVKDCEQLSVLPIIGIGGMGKTTLAQLVYNDERVSLNFDTRLWICVSDDFDLKVILNSIIESATGVSPNLGNLSSLQYRVRQELNEKRYLLILDDVWNENQEDWFKLKSILACGSMGASIVVTTRLKNVADIMGTLPAHCLAQLSEEHCWLLFRLRAFGQENEEHPNLETIGRRIVKKCGGVPLAAKAVGGLLRFKREEKEWIRVEESQIWNLTEEENSIIPVLRLSYHHLPFVLKRCFVYCSVFPKDYRFKKEELIFHWMAHGCISSNNLQEVEDVGDQTWNELALRSFFQEISTMGRGISFKMHDLVHDLAQSIMENKILGAKDSSAMSSDFKIREVHWGKHVKTATSSITVVVSTLTTIMKYNRLRTLKLNSWRVEELPSAIGKLKHLQHLDLSTSSISTLPRTFCCLSNLQILNLNFCHKLKSLPKNIRYMTSLRHIFLERCWGLSHVPHRIGELVSLKTLSLFIVDNGIGNQLDELEHLNLGGRLEIKHLENVQNHMNAKKANLVEKPNLGDLHLHWGDNSRSSEITKMMDDEKVLEALEPHPNLTDLNISGFKGRRLALWVEKIKNITSIYLFECRNITHLPTLGDLPLLKFLGLYLLDALEYITEENEIHGGNSVKARFPSLEKLMLQSLPNLKGFLKEEEVGEMFPNLQTLHIRLCPLLKATSTFVSSALKNLEEVRCSPLILPSISLKIEHLSSLELDFSEIDHTTAAKCNNMPEDTLQGRRQLKILHVDNVWQNRLLEKWSCGLNSLTELELRYSKIGSGFPEGWLRHLTALEELRTWDCSGELIDMAEEIKHLKFLKRLSLQYVDDLVSLPQGLQHIPSLQSLTLRGLDQLTSLPDWLPNLVSLTRLVIDDCPAIPSLPSCIKEMRKLRHLEISECPQLQMRCMEPNGEDWHKISHIPQLSIEYPS